MSAHDRHLTAYRAYYTDAYCTNTECPAYAEAVSVDFQEENGFGSIRPEECAVCKKGLDLEAPREAL